MFAVHISPADLLAIIKPTARSKLLAAVFATIFIASLVLEPGLYIVAARGVAE